MDNAIREYPGGPWEHILATIDADVVSVTFNKPEWKNSLHMDMVQELTTLVDLVARDPGARVLVLTGAGSAFSSGGNVRAMGETSEQRTAAHPLNRPILNLPTMTATERLQLERQTGKRLMLGVANLEKPTIAAVNGIAAGAGMDISLACDFRFVSETAVFYQVYVRRGLAPIDGGFFWLPRIVGYPKALELMYTGDGVDAREAERIGLVNRVYAPDELMPATLKFARRLAEGPAIAQQMIKSGIRASLHMSLDESLDLSYKTYEYLLQTADHQEGVRSFLERRPAQFRGR